MNRTKVLEWINIDIILFSLLIISIFIPIPFAIFKALIFGNILNIFYRMSTYNEDIFFILENKVINLFFLLYICIPVLSIIWINDFDLYFGKILDIVNHVLIFFIVLYYSKVKKNYIEYVCYIFLFISIIYCCVSLWEIITLQHFSYSHYYGKPIPIPTGFFVNENNQAMVILFIFPFLIYIYDTLKNKILKGIVFTVILSITVIVCIEGARLVLMVLLPVFMCFVLLKLPKKITIFLIILFIFGLNHFSKKYPDDFSLAREYMIHQYRSIGEEKNGIILGSTKSRINMLKRAIRIFGQQPLLGSGAGGYDFIVRNDDFSDVEWIENTHNYFFETLANYGIIVFMSLILFWFTIMMKLFNIYSKAKKGKNKTFIICSIIFMIFFIFGSSIPSSMTNLYQCWVMFGLIVAFLTENDVCEKNFYEKK